MDLAHCSRRNRKKADAEIARDVEGRRVDDAHGAPRHRERLLLRQVVGVSLLLGQIARGARDVLRRDVGRRGRAVEDVQLLERDVGKVADVGLEVLGQDLLGAVREQLAQQLRVVVRKVALVENEDEFGALVERLDAVRHAGGEKPEVAGLQVVDKVLAVLVDGGDAHAAVEDVGPFVGAVPVHFAVGVGGQAHVDAGHLRRDRQVVVVLLPRPARVLADAGAVRREAEGPFGVGDGAVVGARARGRVAVYAVVVVGSWSLSGLVIYCSFLHV